MKTTTYYILLLFLLHSFSVQSSSKKEVTSTTPVANFTANVTSGCSPLTVQFTDQSTNAVSWLWNFGDGTTSTLQNPSHTYTTNDDRFKFTVTLTVTSATSETDQEVKVDYIFPDSPGADFLLIPANGVVIPHTVFFTDNSYLPDTWSWDFGDGSTSTLQNPVHNYTSYGDFTVTLTVTDTVTGCSNTKQKIVRVQSPTANFTSTVSATNSLAYNFTNTSTALPNNSVIASYLWDFGDGTTSTVQNPTHTYATLGNFTVSLSVTTANGFTDVHSEQITACGGVTSTIYVDATAPSGGDGLSWATAFTNLQDGLNVASCPSVTEIWVAKGTYKPTTSTDRTIAFIPPQGVKLYGGFNGTETNVNERNWNSNKTILSGDIGTIADINDNSSTVVHLENSNTTVDGFIIENGNADHASNSIERFGAGVYVSGSANNNHITNCIIRNNEGVSGIGLANFATTLTNTVTLTNVLLHNNIATHAGGAIGAEGGTTKLINCTVVNNSAPTGEALRAFNANFDAVNTIFAGNNGNDVFSVITGAGAITYSYCSFDVAFPTTSNTTNNGNSLQNTDPLFANATNNNYNLLAGSSLKNIGNSGANTETKDLAGNDRVLETTIDFGAYEYRDPCASVGSIVYVDANATTGNNNGSDWANAFTSLESALALQDCGFTGEIRVAGNATYKPSAYRLCTAGCSTPRDAYFLINKDIQLKGSYNTTTNLQDYNSPSILDGDIGTIGDAGDNTIHILITTDLTNTAIIDGFTIQNGNARFGGSVTVNAKTILLGNGGAIYNETSSPILSNLIINKNNAITNGGGMFNGASSPIINNTVFSENSAERGGGIYNAFSTSSPTISNSIFYNNSASVFGGGMYNYHASPTIINNTFVRNSDNSGGGAIFNLQSLNIILYNTVFYNNNTDIFNNASTPSISSSNNFSQDYAGAGFSNFIVNPFVNDNNPIGPDGIWLTADDGLLPNSTSILIDAGNNTLIAADISDLDNDNNTTEPIPFDISNQNRVFDANGDGTATVDVGAYEIQTNLCAGGAPPNRIYVTTTGTATNSGANWENATSLEHAFELINGLCATGNEEIWVAKGTYKPTTTSNRELAFQISKRVKVYGGFAGNETSLPERDWNANTTILSGDIGTTNDTSDNSFTVLRVLNGDVLIDGFTIQDGNANDNTLELYDDQLGAGIFTRNAHNFTMKNCIVRNNNALLASAWYHYNGTNTQAINCLFYGNTSTNKGAIHGDYDAIALINNTIVNNTAGGTSGIVETYQSTITITNSIIAGSHNTSTNPNTKALNSGAFAVSYSYLKGEDQSANNGIDATTVTDPLFVNAGANDYRLQNTSSAVNVGNNGANPETKDLAGNDRVLETTIDLGAYEYKIPPFTEASISLPGVELSSVAWGDYNNDGHLDVLLTGSTGSGRVSKIYTNNGNNTFDELDKPVNGTTALPGVSHSSVAWGDYDNDGDLDILLTGLSGSGSISKIYTNNGDSTFSELTGVNLLGFYNSSVAWGDYDNDGDLDILLTGWTGSGRISKIYTNNGSGSFNELTSANLLGVNGSSVAWGDYDNDGDLDILLTGSIGSSSRISKIYTNKGNGRFDVLTSANLTGVQASSVAWGDYDNDGDLDFLLTGYTGGSSYISKIYTNNGNGGFDELTSANLLGVSSSSVAWGDYDNDGDLDILLTGYDGSVRISKIYTNEGSGNFKELDSVNLTGVTYSSVAWGDYDNDGDLDILLTGDDGSTRISKIYTNNATVANTVPTAPTNPMASVNRDKVTLSWDVSTDTETPSAGLTYNVYIKEGASYTKSPMAQENNGWRKLPALGNAQQNTSYTYVLPESYCGTTTNFTFKVQAIDQSFAGSDFSTEGSFTVDFSSPKRLYVNEAITTSGDGSSWVTAFKTLEEAITASTSCGDEIWVAKGTYKPTTTDDRERAFVPKKGLKIYGGFAGNETDLSERDWNTNPTILSGDIGTTNDASDNSFTVLRVLNEDVLIDGFTIQDGNANDNTLPLYDDQLGAGIFTRNAKNFIMKNCIVRNNNALLASAWYHSSGTNTQAINCVFYGNTSTNNGTIHGDFDDLALINNTIVNNTANGSSGIVDTYQSAITITNSIIDGNHNTGTNPNTKALNSGTFTVTYSYLKGEDQSVNNGIDATTVTDPLFTDAVNHDYTLKFGSVLINAGDNTANTETKDIAGNTRKVQTIDIGAYEYQQNITKWTGTANTDWKDTGNWTNGLPDNPLQGAVIPFVGITNFPVVQTNDMFQVQNFYLADNATLTINSGTSLEVLDNETSTTSANIIVHSNATTSGSYIVRGTSGAKVTYHRYVKESSDPIDDTWHLVGAPVIGQAMNNFATDTNNDLRKNNDGSLYAIAPYNNNFVSPAVPWEYVQVANIASAGNFENGKGYGMLRGSSGTFTFTGTHQNTDAQIPVTQGTTNHWNLIANPYPAFIPLSNASATTNFLTQNAGVINSTNTAVYLWDGATKEYKPFNHLNTAIKDIAPGQGFFIQTIDGGGMVTIPKSLLKHSSDDAFLRLASRFEITLQLTNGEETKTTEIVYTENTTKGLDVGYDAGVFINENERLKVYTQLIDNDGTNYSLQGLPNANYEDMIIPIGVVSEENKEITFTAKAFNIPSGVAIYLEDKLTGSFTNLTETSDEYKITTSEALSGTGRFYLHTSSKALSNQEVFEGSQLTMFMTHTNVLTIQNLQGKQAQLQVYDLLGKEVFASKIKVTKSTHEVSLQELSSAVYIVRVHTSAGSKTQKIVKK